MKEHSIITILFLVLIGFILWFYSLHSSTNSEYFGIIEDECEGSPIRLLNNYVDCDWQRTGVKLGKGKIAEVWEGSCPGVDKLVAIKEIDYPNMKSLENEANLQHKASTQGLAPEVYDAFICGNVGYLVTDKVQMNIKDYLELFPTGSQEQLAQLNNLRNQAIRLVQLSNEAGLLHTDLNFSNMMVNISENNEPMLIFIDWDASREEFLDEEDLEQKITGINQTFDLLYSKLTTYSSKSPPELKKKKKIKSFSGTKLFDSPEKKRFSPMKAATTSKKGGGLFDDDDSFISRPQPQASSSHKKSLMDDFEAII